MTGLTGLDTAVFVAYLLLLVGVGLWFTSKQKGLKSYLLADQNVHWVIVAISVLAALFSGITYLGAPAESFFYDLSYLWVVISFFIATPITTLIFLPFFRNLNIYTAYEYLEKRFDYRLRWIASSLFIIRMSFYLGLVISAPALAIMEITNLEEYWQSVLITGAAATLYTALGGMKAVIWTDSIQFVVLCGGIILILGFAIAGVPGGLPAVWAMAAADGKTQILHLDLDPTVRMTLWAALLGGTCINLVQMVTDQIAVQRYLTAVSLKASQKALWLKLWLTLPLVGMFYLTGTVLYGYYRTLPDRAPPFLQAQLVPNLPQPHDVPIKQQIKNDRLLPYFVVHELPSPLPGLLIAAVFGATMAVVSAGINSLATAALMDFGSRSPRMQHSERRQFRRARLYTIMFGVLATTTALVMGRLGTLLEATNKIMGLFGGPLLGIFFLAVMSRRANGTGAILGAAFGAVLGIMTAFSKELFDWPISFMWISFFSAGSTYIVGWFISLFFNAPNPAAQMLVYRKHRPIRTEDKHV